MTQKVWKIFTLLVLLVALPLSAAFAQSRSDWREILVRISELEGHVEVLKRDARAASGEDLDPGQRALLADMEVRIGQLETEIRKLTGLIEEVSFRQTRIEEDIDLFRREVDLRFQDLSSGTTAVALTPDIQPEATEIDPEAGFVAEAVELPSVTLPDGTEEERYQFAFQLLRKGDFPSAEAAFIAFLDAHPTHSLAANAQYWLAETYYVRKDFPEAAAAFLKGFQTYGDGAKGADSLLKLGMSLSSLNQNEQACSAFEELFSRYGDANEAVLSQASKQQERLGCS